MQVQLKLKYHQFKTILFTYRLLYQEHIVTTNQKSTIETHTKKKKESKHNTKVSHQITREENKEDGRKKSTKTKPKQENGNRNIHQIRSDQLLSPVQLFATS